MSYMKFFVSVTLSAALYLTGCGASRNTQDANRTGDANRIAATDAQQHRDEDVNRLEMRLNDIDRKWADKEQKLAQERAAATASLRAEVNQDITNARRAVNDLKTTTPDNWWQREEGVLSRTTGELERDVQRFTGKPLAPPNSEARKETKDHGTAFADRRDEFINGLQRRVDAMKQQLDRVKTKGTENTELHDTKARVNKLDSDLAELRKATPDDWWKVSNDRVTDYIDRLDKSVGRLDDNKPKS